MAWDPDHCNILQSVRLTTSNVTKRGSQHVQTMTRNENRPLGHLPRHLTQWCLSVRFSICPAWHSSSQRPSSRSFQYCRVCPSSAKFNARHSFSRIHRQPRNYTPHQQPTQDHQQLLWTGVNILPHRSPQDNKLTYYGRPME